MNIAFRVDASYNIGSGHIMRCLTLADELKKRSHNVIFICRELEGNLLNVLRNRGHDYYTLPKMKEKINSNLYHAGWLEVNWDTDAEQTINIITKNNLDIDFLIVDHYAIDTRWETLLYNIVKKIIVIDDLADRKHNCDVLIDQNFYLNMDSRYNELLPEKCVALLGPKYSLIRDEFLIERNSKKREAISRRGLNILITYGGTDPTNETYKALHAIEELEEKIDSVHVVVGQSNKAKKKIYEFCEKREKYFFHCQIDYMAKLMNICDFAICAAGTTTWERYCLGLPGVVTAVAHNQIEICHSLDKLGVDTFLGLSHDVTTENIINLLGRLIINYEELTYKKNKAMEIVDGYGKYRIIDWLDKILSGSVG